MIADDNDVYRDVVGVVNDGVKESKFKMDLATLPHLGQRSS